MARQPKAPTLRPIDVSISHSVRRSPAPAWHLSVPSPSGLVLAVTMLLPAMARPQMHKVTAPDSVVRAIGVYEWTGDLSKPVASRLIPVALFIDGKLEDAGVYLARPVPFALESGNVYELEQHGLPQGTLELAYARHLTATSNAEGFDDGWFGYGSYKAQPAAKPEPKLRRGTLATVNANPAQTASAKDDGRPHFSNRSGTATSGSSATQPSTGEQASGSASPASSTGSGTTSANSSTPAATTGATPAGDPERPTLQRRNGGQATSAAGKSGAPAATQTASAAAANTPAPAADPDRPVLKRRTTPPPSDSEHAESSSASVGAVASLNNDPNRPIMRRGKPTRSMTEDDLPKLKGLPADLHQEIAVSDAKNREEHDFSLAWTSNAQRADITAKLRALAQPMVAAYIKANAPLDSPRPTTSQSPAAGATAARTTTRSHTPAHSATHRKVSATKPVLPDLLDEQTKGYTLSYSAMPTYIYTAHTTGDGDTLRYITVVAQQDVTGAIHSVLTSVTDAAHEDRTPWMRPVGVVDAEATNRASILMELRGQHARQFALYRVLGGSAQQIFLSGTTQ
jgi:hypothetical protein